MDMDHWTNQSEDLTGNMQIICLPRQHTSNNHFIPYIATYVKLTKLYLDRLQA